MLSLAGDDPPLYAHVLSEMSSVIGIPVIGIPLLSQVEAHPKIKQFPFKGAHELHQGAPTRARSGPDQRPAGPFTFKS